MFNFQQLVESILLEAFNPSVLEGIIGQPKQVSSPNEWLYDLLDLHSKLFPSIPIESRALTNCFSSALGTYNSKPKVNIIKNCAPLERVYDVFYKVAQQTKNKIVATSLQEFASNSDIQTAGEAVYANIPQNGPWELTNPDVINAYNVFMAEKDLLAKAALETYYKKSILQTVNEAVKKRTDVFSRISVVRTPFGQPFANLLKDALINPEQYASGNKKVTNDFKQIVDDLYFKQIIAIGLTAKEFYKSVAGQNPSNTINYENMLNNENGGFTVEEIQNKGTKEALALIEALRNIAEYERKKAGRGETIGKAAGALGALRTGMGPVG